ncbi:MAG: hypothetical protein ACM3KI_11030 [Bacillota bacterium]
MKTILISKLKVNDQLKTAYNSVIVVNIEKRNKTSKVFYRCLDGFMPTRNFWVFKNTDEVRILN